MTLDECETLMGFLKGAFPRLTDDQIETYSSMLMSEEVEAASNAILSGVNDWKHPPTWADIKERIRSLERRAGAVPKDEPVPEIIEDFGIPEFGREWIYARCFRDPPDLRPFRESYPKEYMDGAEPVGGWMPTHEYREAAKAVTDEKVRAVLRSGVDIMELLGPT